MPLPNLSIFATFAMLTSLAPRAGAHAQDARAQPPRYATDLGTLGLQLAEAAALNNAGLIAGTDAEATSGRHPVRLFIVPVGGRITNTQAWASPSHVDEAGTVVGTSFWYTSSRAFRWSASNGVVELPFTPNGRRDEGVGIDGRGRIVVNSNAGAQRVFVWGPEGGTFTELPRLHDLDVVASAVSPGGTIVGLARQIEERSVDEANLVHETPVVWDAATQAIQALPVLRAADGTPWDGEATDVNDAGTIVGTLAHDGQVHSVAWTGPEHTLRDLGPGVALAINAHDVVAGAAQHAARDVNGFARRTPHLWDLRRGTSFDLQGLRAEPTFVRDGEATDINDHGVAVGWLEATSGNGKTHAVVFDAYAP